MKTSVLFTILLYLVFSWLLSISFQSGIPSGNKGITREGSVSSVYQGLQTHARDTDTIRCRHLISGIPEQQHKEINFFIP